MRRYRKYVVGGTRWNRLVDALCWGAVIALVIWGIRTLAGHRDKPVEAEAYEVLRLRYARGEITKEQFEEIKAALSS